MDGPTRRKVAILGGGIGALAAAFKLTQQPDWQQRFDITVYQLGWRLGGKGASARNPARNDRIEEHGLHVWAGFYENAFAMMNAVYAEYPWPTSPIRTIRQAFLAESHISLAEQYEGRWSPWRFFFPPNEAWPGDGSADLPGPLGILVMLLDWLDELHGRLPEAIRARVPAGPVQPVGPLGISDQAAATAPEGGGARLLHFAGAIIDRLVEAAAPKPATSTAQANAAGALLRTYHQGLVATLSERPEVSDPAVRHLIVALDLLRCISSAVIADGILADGFAAVDNEDFIALLRRHHALDMTVASPAVMSGYDYAFGYPGGDHDRPSMSAASAIEGLLRLGLTYKGALFFKMAAGAGEILFAPIYELLRRRGVKFAFFHRVTRLVPADGAIAAIEIAVQATTKPQQPAYQPLIEVGGMQCWPPQPLFDQLANGEALQAGAINLEDDWQDYSVQTRTLKRGTDFDAVVLGIPVGALRTICADLAVPGSRWERMLGAIQTTATQALQLWCDWPVTALGGAFVTPQQPPDVVGTIVTNFQPPFDTWADMSHLLAHESWPAGGVPRSVAYFCAVLPDQPPPPTGQDPLTAATAVVAANAADWMNRSLGGLWPKASDANGFDWKVLHAAAGAVGPARLADQYWRANVSGSERYVLSLPGTLQYRLPPEPGDYANLYLAGDWVRVPAINAGCMECAVMAGFGAAAALAGTADDTVA